MDWGLVSAIATSASAIVIGWQAFETRRSANKSNDAVDVANKTLEVARSDAERARVVMEEAVRARFDAGAPDIRMRFLDGNDIPEEYGLAILVDGEPLQRIDSGYIVNYPQDRGLNLGVVYEIAFLNEAATSATINIEHGFFHQELDGVWRGRDQRINLDGGQRVEGFLFVACTVDLWVFASKSTKRMSASGVSGWATVMEGTSGVKERQAIRIVGSILEELDEGVYAVGGTGGAFNNSAFLQYDPKERAYVLASGKILTEPDADTMNPSEKATESESAKPQTKKSKWPFPRRGTVPGEQ